MSHCTGQTLRLVEHKPGKLSHLYDNRLYKKLVRGLRKPRTSISCRLYEQFAAYTSRGLCNPRLIFPRINGPNVTLHWADPEASRAKPGNHGITQQGPALRVHSSQADSVHSPIASHRLTISSRSAPCLSKHDSVSFSHPASFPGISQPKKTTERWYPEVLQD